MSRDAALLLNFGGPTSLERVQPFLEELFADPEILPFPRRIRVTLARWIARRRAPTTIEQYKLIGGKSPLVADTFEVAASMGKLLGPGIPIYAAMAYTPPWIGSTVERILADGVERLVCLSMYPHYSVATAGSVFNVVAEELERRRSKLEVLYVPAWYEHPAYLEAMCDRAAAGLATMPDDGRGTHLLFSAHGLPVSFVRKRDPYQRHIQETIRTLVARLSWTGPYSLAYQSRVGPVRWLAPSTDAEIERLAHAGTRRAFVVPVSFVSDHIETLYEIDILYGDKAKALGFEVFRRMDAVATHPRFIECLADLVQRGLGGAYRRTCVRCLLPREVEHFRHSACPECRFARPRFQIQTNNFLAHHKSQQASLSY